MTRNRYLAHKTLVGAQMRYAVHDRDGWRVDTLRFKPCDTEAGAVRPLCRTDP